MKEPQAYAVCMSELNGGEAYMKQVGHGRKDGYSTRTACGLRPHFDKNWRRTDYRDGITCNRCRKSLGLQPVNADPRWY